MRINIIGKGIEVDSALDAHIRRRINFVLGRFSIQVGRVNVTLIDENGTKDGLDKTCRIHITLSGLPTVVVEHMDAELHTAIDYSTSRVGRTVSRKLSQALTSIGDKRAGGPMKEEP